MGENIKIGHYMLGKTIGSGGFARVREGRHLLTGTPVAVKILNKEKMKNKNMISKVKREIRILRFITHPHVIKLYQVLDTSKEIFVVMELARNGQLYQYLQENDLTQDTARNFFEQILQGLEWAHLHLVAHRDLKPQNILLDGNLNCKIADFGLSNLMKDGKHLKTSCGSLNYAPPEILARQPYEGTAADIWSCGIILYTLLAAALPFDEEVVSILYKKIEKAEFTIPPQVSPPARDLLRRMIVTDPKQRISIRQIKIHPWLRKSLPLYMQVAALATIPPEKSEEVDEESLNRVRTFNMDSLQKNLGEEQVKRIIKGRMDYSFATAYQLLKDEKGVRTPTTEQKNSGWITESVTSKVSRLQGKPKGSGTFGRWFKHGVQTVFGSLLEVFRRMEIVFTVKNEEYCLMCSRGEEKLRLNWVIQLYEGERGVLVDLRLVRGHPLTFIGLSRRFYCCLSSHLQK